MDVASPSVMLLGTWHWGGSAGDYADVHCDASFVADRQVEIRDVARRLARFRPTAVAVEVQQDALVDLNHRYERYVAGEEDLTTSEIHQLGFRIAAQSGVRKLDGVDWHSDVPIGWDTLVSSSKGTDDERRLNTVLAEAAQRFDAIAEMLRSQTIAQVLQYLNSPESLRRELSTYSNLIMIGGDMPNAGARVVTRWYERNLVIAANIARLLIHDQCRILVIVGLAHLPPLLHILSGLESTSVVTAEEYLSEH